jgi:hypothetical protein
VGEWIKGVDEVLEQALLRLGGTDHGGP